MPPLPPRAFMECTQTTKRLSADTNPRFVLGNSLVLIRTNLQTVITVISVVLFSLSRQILYHVLILNPITSFQILTHVPFLARFTSYKLRNLNLNNQLVILLIMAAQFILVPNGRISAVRQSFIRHCLLIRIKCSAKHICPSLFSLSILLYRLFSLSIFLCRLFSLYICLCRPNLSLYLPLQALLSLYSFLCRPISLYIFFCSLISPSIFLRKLFSLYIYLCKLFSLYIFFCKPNLSLYLPLQA